jgi:F-type H+-transporting ATPase subunit gamma
VAGKGRELRSRIRSVENTKRITRTMEMVATSKLKRAQDRVVGARPYAAVLREILADLYSSELADRFPLLRQPAKVNRAAVLLLTSNRGLAGAFNANLIREARGVIERLEKDGAEVELHVVGRKGLGYFRYVGRRVASSRTDITDRPTADDAKSLVDDLMQQFIDHKLDALYLVSAKYNSPLSTPPVSEQVLPIKPPERRDQRVVRNYILAPNAEEILGMLLPAYVRNTVYRALVETAASEQGARRTAMKNATDNATDLLSTYRRNYNRARQAQITQEIAEIVGGAAALE